MAGEGEAPWDPETKRPDVAVLVALKEETLVLRDVVGRQAFHARPNAAFPGHDYLLFADNDRGRPYRVVLYFMDDMGPPAAAAAAQRLLQMSPRLMVNIGIACSLHTGDLPLCSVLVASQVDGYDERSKAEDDAKGGWAWKLGGKVYSPTEQWGRIAGDLAFSHPERFEQWQEQCASDFAALVDRARDGKRIDALRHKGHLPERPVLQRGHVATGVSVAAAAAFKKQVLERDRNIKALEMEAAGMLRAVRERLPVVDTLVIKGVSDLGDANKKVVDAIGPGAIRKVAMRNAVRLLWALMKAGLLPQGRDGAQQEAMRLVEGAPVSGPIDLATPTPLEDDTLVDALAELFEEGEAKLVLSRVRFPRAQQPRFSDGLTFWHDVVIGLRNGVVKGDGVQKLVDVAAKLRPGNALLARHSTSSKSRDLPSPERASQAPRALGPGVPTTSEPALEHTTPAVDARFEWEQRLVTIIARKIDEQDGLLGWLGERSGWAAAAKRGSIDVAKALLAEDEPVALIRGIREAMTPLTDAQSRATPWANTMNAVLFLALPAVAGRGNSPRQRPTGRSWSINADYPITAETRMAREDGRPMELSEWRRGVEPRPRAYITPETPEGGARLEQRVLDMKRDIESRQPVEAHDLLGELALGVLRASGSATSKHHPRDRIINRARLRANDGRSRVDPSCMLTYYTMLLDDDDRELAEMLASELERHGLIGLRVLVPQMQDHEREEDDELEHELEQLRNVYGMILEGKP